MFERLIPRVLMAVAAGTCAFFFLYWPVDYFRPDLIRALSDTQAFFIWLGLMGSVLVIGFPIARVYVALAPIIIAGWAVMVSLERLDLLLAAPDVSGDGRFTIRDLFPAFLLVITEPGQRYSDLIFGTLDEGHPIVAFFEIGPNFANWITRVILTSFTWFMVIGWWMAVRTAKRSDYDGPL